MKKYLLILLLLPLLSFAQNQYKINLIIFKHYTQRAYDSENWLAIPPLEIPTNAVALYKLKKQKNDLNIIARKLKNQKNYEILLNKAWIQKIRSKRKTKPIVFRVGDNVEGVLYFSKNSFFNLKTQIHLKLNNGKVIELAENRRLTLNQLNYLDNPLFGLFVEILPDKDAG